MDKQKNLFSEIFAYRQSGTKTPLENYCTEIFVYILRRLIQAKNRKAQKILELFGFNKLSEKDFEHITIVTREQHYSETYKRNAFPDIIINLRSKNVVIEVKVESGLGNYNKTKTQTFDQIELYKSISDVSDVFSLSKNVLFNDTLDNSRKILWSQIHSILKGDKNEIVDNFVRFLEEKGMGTSVVEKGAEKAVDYVSSILNLIEKSWTNEKYKLKERDSTSRNFIGFYVKDINTAWIGQLKEKKEYIVFQPLDKLVNKAEKIKGKDMEQDDNENYIFAKIKLSEITSCKTDKEQKEKFQKWINDEINPLLK